MLRDSAHIQESDAAWENQKGRRAGRDLVEPLYTLSDAESALALLTTCDYGQPFEVCPGVRAEFFDAGHLLGSAMIRLTLQEGGTEKSIVFFRRYRKYGPPHHSGSTYLKSADYVVMETTYGDRDHEPEHAYTELAKIIDETLGRGGNVVIPAFAVGRTQELLYYIREIKEKKMVRSVPDFPVYVDSPLAREATQIFSGDLRGYTDDETTALVRQGNQYSGIRRAAPDPDDGGIQASQSGSGSQGDPLSASGMCDAGRIRHHLKHNLWREECTVVFVGFQAVGSLGRILTDGADRVKLLAKKSLSGLKSSSCTGCPPTQTALRCCAGSTPPPGRSIYFLVHGEAEVATAFAETLRQAGLSAHAPDFTEVYDLAANTMVQAGIPAPEKKKAAGKGFPGLSEAMGYGPAAFGSDPAQSGRGQQGPGQICRPNQSAHRQVGSIEPTTCAQKTHAFSACVFFVFWFIL